VLLVFLSAFQSGICRTLAKDPEDAALLHVNVLRKEELAVLCIGNNILLFEAVVLQIVEHRLNGQIVNTVLSCRRSGVQILDRPNVIQP